MTDTCVVALIGLPAAGKSSFCRWLLDKHIECYNMLHICYDELLNVPNNGGVDNMDVNFDNINYKEQRLNILQKIQTLIHDIQTTAELTAMHVEDNGSAAASTANTNQMRTNTKRKLIICDDNNYYRSMRYQLYKICRVHKLAYAQIYFKCDLATALERNRSRCGNARLTDHVLSKMNARLEIPAPNEYSWEANTLCLDALQPLNEQIILITNFLNAAFDHIPLATIDTEPTMHTQPASVIHQLDMLLRQRIKHLMLQMNDCSDAMAKQSRAQDLNAKRIAILQKFRGEQSCTNANTLGEQVNDLIPDCLEEYVKNALR